MSVCAPVCLWPCLRPFVYFRGYLSLQEGMATHSSILAWRVPMDRGACLATAHGVTESDMIERLSTAQLSLGTCVPVCVLLCVFCVYPCVCEWTGASCLDTYRSPWPAAVCLSFHTVEMPCAFQRIRWSHLSALHMSLNQRLRRRIPPDALALSGWPACPCPCSSAHWVGP